MQETLAILPTESAVSEAIHQLQKPEIDAPANFVSVYHETKSEFLPSIVRQGLMTAAEARNMGGPISCVNAALDANRPAWVTARGVSRTNNLYAYPYLEVGHGLYGADQRFVSRSESRQRKNFEAVRTYEPGYLQRLGVTTVDAYLVKMNDPAYLKQEYPGEVLELKVDPAKSYVIDMDLFTKLQDGRQRGWIDDDDMPEEAAEYWKGLLTLGDFQKYYKRAQYAPNGNDIVDGDSYRDGERGIIGGHFCPTKEASADMPYSLYLPEILLPNSIPTTHLRLLI